MTHPSDKQLYEAAACELLRAIRGTRSQVAWSRRLGYRGNPVTHWERGTRHATALEALRAAVVAGLHVREAFSHFVPLAPPTLEPTQSTLHEWLDQLRGSASVGELAKRFHCSRHTMGRWLSGRTQPRLHEFLHLLEVCTGRVHDWVAQLVDIQSVPSLKPAFERAAAARLLAVQQPWTEPILRTLETDGYQHDPVGVLRTLAPCLGISQEELHAALSGLVKAGIVTTQDGVYTPVRELSVDNSREALNRLQAHWLRVAERRVLQENDQDWFAYNVISVSQADRQRIHEVMKRAFSESRAIVAASEPTESTALVLMHLIKW